MTVSYLDIVHFLDEEYMQFWREVLFLS